MATQTSFQKILLPKTHVCNLIPLPIRCGQFLKLCRYNICVRFPCDARARLRRLVCRFVDRLYFRLSRLNTIAFIFSQYFSNRNRNMARFVKRIRGGNWILRVTSPFFRLAMLVLLPLKYVEVQLLRFFLLANIILSRYACEDVVHIFKAGIWWYWPLFVQNERQMVNDHIIYLYRRLQHKNAFSVSICLKNLVVVYSINLLLVSIFLSSNFCVEFIVKLVTRWWSRVYSDGRFPFQLSFLKDIHLLSTVGNELYSQQFRIPVPIPTKTEHCFGKTNEKREQELTVRN